jgi:hypothetical protein
LRRRNAEPEPRGTLGNRWKEHRSDQGAVTAEPSRKQYSCHLIIQNDWNNRAATGSQQSSDIRVHHNKVSFLFNKTHDLKRIAEGSGVVVARGQPREVVVRENGARVVKTRSSPRPFTGALRGHGFDDGMPISRPVLGPRIALLTMSRKRPEIQHYNQTLRWRNDRTSAA